MQKKVHRLVMAAFVGPCPDGMEVCHNDGNPANNYVGNLRYDTHQANYADMFIHNTHGMATKTHCRNNHEFSPGNTLIHNRKNGRTQRSCRSCWAAKSYINRHPEMKPSFQALADSYFEKYGKENHV
ncbi:HNH endonuclease signature motif containing protein [Corynebacterium kefirresidentii]|uniref:HNH endonuclease signature motif containing protein n=1 Tax=Corynebacterium kefirresidentii TaxID=1979527 RepID=UPI0020055900|nr:HNH endonuclease signature motif containing protein [Corynebacterium kefirresidentii]